ncbi:MAG: hypothetical protein ACE5K4_06980 [Candidatus Hydrothermarchaeota archaeon]
MLEKLSSQLFKEIVSKKTSTLVSLAAGVFFGLVSYIFFRGIIVPVCLGIIAFIAFYMVSIPLEAKWLEKIKRDIDIELGEAGRLILMALHFGSNDLESIQAVTGLSDDLLRGRIRILTLMGLINEESGLYTLTDKGKKYVKRIKKVEW